MLVQCWSTVADGGLALNQYCLNASCELALFILPLPLMARIQSAAQSVCPKCQFAFQSLFVFSISRGALEIDFPTLVNFTGPATFMTRGHGVLRPLRKHDKYRIGALASSPHLWVNLSPHTPSGQWKDWSRRAQRITLGILRAFTMSPCLI